MKKKLFLCSLLHSFAPLFNPGLRPLHYAAYQKYTDCVNLLLVRGADIDVMDDIGYTAVHLCAERGYFDLLQILLEHGAKVKFTELKPDEKVEFFLSCGHTLTHR